jgi:hypothetical protein
MSVASGAGTASITEQALLRQHRAPCAIASLFSNSDNRMLACVICVGAVYL